MQNFRKLSIGINKVIIKAMNLVPWENSVILIGNLCSRECLKLIAVYKLIESYLLLQFLSNSLRLIETKYPKWNAQIIRGYLSFSVVNNVGIVPPELKLKGCCKSGLVQRGQISPEGSQRWFCAQWGADTVGLWSSDKQQRGLWVTATWTAVSQTLCCDVTAPLSYLRV